MKARSTEHDARVAERAQGLTDWLIEVLRARWPLASLERRGATRAGSHVWLIEAAGEQLWLAVTEPVLATAAAEEITGWLVDADWLSLLRRLTPDGHGLLVTTDGRFFAWDPARDRGVRLIELG